MKNLDPEKTPAESRPTPLCPACDGPTRFMCVVKGEERWYCPVCEVAHGKPARKGAAS